MKKVSFNFSFNEEHEDFLQNLDISQELWDSIHEDWFSLIEEAPTTKELVKNSLDFMSTEEFSDESKVTFLTVLVLDAYKFRSNPMPSLQEPLGKEDLV